MWECEGNIAQRRGLVCDPSAKVVWRPCKYRVCVSITLRRYKLERLPAQWENLKCIRSHREGVFRSLEPFLQPSCRKFKTIPYQDDLRKQIVIVFCKSSSLAVLQCLGIAGLKPATKGSTNCELYTHFYAFLMIIIFTHYLRYISRCVLRLHEWEFWFKVVNEGLNVYVFHWRFFHFFF